MSNCKYSPEHIEFIRSNISGCRFKELTNRFNKQFGMNLSVLAMISLADRHGLHNGIDSRLNTGHKPTQFKKGHVPFNKGKKGISYPGMEPTQFKPGNRPWNYMPVGSERVNADGYVDIKIADPNKWKGKHILIWEAANGPVPRGYVVIFGDGNNRNFEPDNLLLVTRAQLVRLNQSNLIQNDAELTKTGIILADIYNKIGKIKKAKRGGSA